VDSFQGNQADVVIVSLVRNNLRDDSNAFGFAADAVLDLPARWERALSPLLLDHIARTTNSPRHLRAVKQAGAIVEDNLIDTELLDSDVFTTAEEHVAELRDILANSQSIIFIASAFFDIAVIAGG